jgi:hypothetical protein
MELDDASLEMGSHTGRVTKNKRKNRRVWISYKSKEVKAKVSGSRTKVTVNGKAIKVGVICAFIYPSAVSEAKKSIVKSKMYSR